MGGRGFSPHGVLRLRSPFSVLRAKLWLLCCGVALETVPLSRAALKKYQMEHKSKGESLEKCQAELKKLRRKSQGSKNPSKYGEKEMQACPVITLLGPRPTSGPRNPGTRKLPRLLLLLLVVRERVVEVVEVVEVEVVEVVTGGA
ncbi:hypothetical protein CRUP_025091 [Coryphaenoides rupestris]|nr:hypothetical protein CRUP_025091 [Coryphaenoides rupestris]